jgi:hypothetical protein
LDRLLEAFEATFRGQVYKHRLPYIGDSIAIHMFEDLYSLGHSVSLNQRIEALHVAVNTGNQIKGKKGRRGDGTLGRVVPGVVPERFPGFVVARGLVANLEVGCEVKIGATKLLAQVDRVVNDLTNQARVFRALSTAAIRIAFVGVNHADSYVGREGEREFTAKSPPAREAPEFARRIESLVAPEYDELLVLRFRATNVEPFPFEWLDEKQLRQHYRSILVRVSAEYTRRFG